MPAFSKYLYDLNFAEECHSHMWEVDGQVQELTTAFFTPLFPINKE